MDDQLVYCWGGDGDQISLGRGLTLIDVVDVPLSITSDGTAEVSSELNAWFETEIKPRVNPVVVRFPQDGVYLIEGGPLLLESYADVTVLGNGATLQRDRILDKSLRYGSQADEAFCMLRNCAQFYIYDLHTQGVNSSDPAVYQGGPGWEEATYNAVEDRWEILDANDEVRSLDAGSFFSEITDPVTGTVYAGRWAGVYTVALEFEHGFTVEDSQDVLIEDCSAVGVGGDGAYLRGATNDGVVVRRLYVERNGRQGAAAINGNNYTFDQCEMWSRRGGIDMEPNVGTTSMQGLEIGNCILATQLLSLPSGGPGPIDDVYIHHNLILYSSTSLIYVSATDSASRTNYRIEDNRSLARASGTGPAIRLDNVTGASVRRNEIPREDFARGAFIEFADPSFDIEVHDNLCLHHPIVVGDGLDGAASTWNESNNTRNDGTPPAAPTNIAGATTGLQSIQITWDAVAGAEGYAVFRWRLDDVVPDFNWAGNTTGTSFTDTDLLPEMLYRYRVVAKDAGLATEFGNFSQPSQPVDVQLPTIVPTAEWLLDDVSGPTISETGGTHDGTLTGSATLTGSSIQFDGASYVEVPYSADFIFGGDFTIMAWVKYATAPVADENILAVDDQGTNNSWRIRVQSDGSITLRVEYDDQTPDFLGGQDADFPFDGAWHHVAWTRFGDEWTYYLDGVHTKRWGRQSDPLFDANVPLRIGADSADPAGHFATAEMGKVAIYDGVALPESSISTRNDEGPPEPVDLLTWAPPDTTGYTTINVPTSGSTPTLDDNTDYVFELPNEPVTDAILIRGGRNIVMIGGEIEINSINYDANGGANESDQHAIYILGGTTKTAGRIIHIEGVHMHGYGLSDGVRTANTNDGPTDADLRIQNCRIELGMWYRDSNLDGTGTPHPDVLQPFAGIGWLRVDKLTGLVTGQGLMLKPDFNAPNQGFMQFKRMNLRENTDSDIEYNDPGATWPNPGRDIRFMWWTNGDEGGIRLEQGTIWFNHPVRNFDESGLQMFWPELVANDYGTDGTGTWATPDFTSGFDGTGTGFVYEGDPPGGDYVPVGVAGWDYVSPGYV